ncbi:DUF2786 domain-containing protein [Catenuloplanes atrovinosus]|uniref:DUF2786 domain-containing protein n=1 Tax=Catenuloplanes atrovinosus TaxID=137266 RepID=A0AAE4CBX2_9ACTN|nr:DUF2786 domain-containing protein [Catenuloplanes atrovinosus]MDR7278563.1 hypothetical protein [Catenuloplanes atrovinosus]
MTSAAEKVGSILSGATAYETGLDELTVLPPADVDPALSAALRRAGERLFRAGWQPVELHRLVTRRSGPDAARLVADAAGALLHRTPAADPRWAAQAAEIGADRWWTSDADYPSELARRLRADRVSVLDLILSTLLVLRTLPPIEILLPPPGTTAPRRNAERSDHRVLERVRALLAKAESTDYPAEAEAYTAKAQEMISRHSLDEALLTADRAEVVPLARRIAVDAPYESEKAALLHAVARANRCHAVWSPEFGFATVFGFDADLDAVDLLHASLLVQAQRAMSRTEPPGGKAGKSRLKAFRASFLVAFAARIGERLARAARAALPDAGGDLLPVLRSRDVQVRETMTRVFPRTERARGARVDSDEGWREGRAAADRATLT